MSLRIVGLKKKGTLVNFPTDDGVSTIVVDGLAVGDL
eukprot:COSAG02_NODE_58701_length_276_cov_1.096045_2_plen_36_part_01